MNNWNRIFKPIVVLCVICMVITLALAATNGVTKPIIDEATRVAQENARRELLPDATGFTQVEGVSVDGVSAIYASENNVGYVFTSSAKGYGGDVVVMTAIVDGTIKQIKVTEQAETKGIGSKVAGDASYWARYQGVSAEQEIELGNQVDALSGATISSRALKNAVNAAIAAYQAIS